MKLLWLRIKYGFTRFRLWVHDFLFYTLPNWTSAFINFTKKNGLIWWGIVGLTGIMFVVGTVSGVNYARYCRERTAYQRQKKMAERMIKVKNIYEEGPEKYLEEQLDCKNKAQVIREFNDSEKWQGRYPEVIQHCQNYKTNKQFQNYLNPIVRQIQNGPLVKQQGIDLTFADKQINPDQDCVVEGVMLVLIDSKNGEQVHEIRELKESHPDYKLVVYDKQSPHGELNFQGLAKSWLWAGEGLPEGFNNSNDWTGVAYAFNNDQMVFHSHSLKNLPKKLPKDDSNITKATN